MSNEAKQLKKISKHLRKAQECTSREQAQAIIRKYEKRVNKLINARNKDLKVSDPGVTDPAP